MSIPHLLCGSHSLANSGALDGVGAGGSDVTCDVALKKWQCHTSVTKYFPCPCQIKKWPCHNLVGPHLAVIKVCGILSNFRNNHVALLILGVKGHNSVPTLDCQFFHSHFNLVFFPFYMDLIN